MPLWWNWQTQGTWLMMSIYRNRGSTYISLQKSLGGDIVPVRFRSAAPQVEMLAKQATTTNDLRYTSSYVCLHLGYRCSFFGIK